MKKGCLASKYWLLPSRYRFKRGWSKLRLSNYRSFLRHLA